MDVANARLELLWAFGSDSMNQFTEYYKELRPLWDLAIAQRFAYSFEGWNKNFQEKNRMKDQINWFVKQAFNSIVK